MDCQRIDAILNEHAIGALSAAERSEADAHLERCQRCADAWLGYETLVAEVLAKPRPGLFDEIAANVTAQPPLIAVRASTQRWVSVAGIAASALLVALLAAVLVPDDDTGLRSIGTGSEIGGIEVADTPSGTTNLSPLLGQPESNAALSEFVAGRDYERVRNSELLDEDSEQIAVCEFFMFECVFCFNFERSLLEWEATVADEVSVERVPALFNSLARLHAQAFYTAEVLGQSEGLHMAFYQEIHDLGNPLASVAAIRDFFGSNGIDVRDFDEAFESRAVEASMRRAEELNALYGVTATPSLGVNGKYLTNPGLTGSNERMFEVVDALVLSEARERCSSGDSDWCPFFE